MIDINCDVGEGLHNEHILMPFISSCNIACGGHAGSVEIIDKVIDLAIENDVKIGAHPSFPDRENFGRVIMNISNKALQQSLYEQLQVFKERADLKGAVIHHVKPHGALYNLIAVNEEKATVVVSVIQRAFKDVKIYVPYNSAIEKVALANQMTIVYEAFADRNYNDDLTLVSRALPYAIITDRLKIVEHVRRMAEESLVKTVQGNEKQIKAQTFCVHGDNKNAIDILKELNEKFISPRLESRGLGMQS
ncbi:5-oxoprolinase subunit PxpA [Flavobacteriaceae bacterium S356]|uniref:5-oxoprolinase subunit PxpA n=1 Tax=Asprobacillus argus TaxID=3076534 RepID=A0ABU3LG31_9FLAO|nr:5-oxoprolinase subunit PxpA [Flavobacteriaceae bacterium S356]